MASSTAELITSLTTPGAERAWSILAERHGQDVWRLIASRLGDVHAVEDAYQEFWLALPAAARRFRPVPGDTERKARAWLMHIAYTTAIAQHRQRRHGAPLSEDAASSPEAEMDERANSQELVERVHQAVEQLPETHRQPLLLHIVAGLSYEDLAAELRCTVNNARVKVHRALAALRGLVGTEGGRLSEQTLAGLLVPPLLLVPPPPPPALPALPALPPVPPPGVLAVLAKAPVLVGGAITAAATATVATVVVLVSPASPVPSEPTVSPIPAVAVALAAATTLAASDDFDRDLPGIVCPDPSIGLSMVDAPTGLGSGKALRIVWPAEHKAYVQVVYDPLRPAPEITEAGGTVDLLVWIEAMAGVKGMSVRFTDSKMETFQWSSPLPQPEQSGWRKVTFVIDPAHPFGSWGPPGQVDKVIDWPVRLNGYAFSFTSETSPSGSLLLDGSVVSAAKP
jgi:RNA polymerase sigma-70 factor, ECF subfamily